jgi:hypothetical protein
MRKKVTMRFIEIATAILTVYAIICFGVTIINILNF